MPVSRIILRPGHDRRAREGHPWIFSNEIAQVEGPVDPGSSVEVSTARGEFLGTAYFNPHSLISARILSRLRESIDTVDFFLDRIGAALAFRRKTYGSLDAMRIVHGEGDGLPGLVVDHYGEVLSIQFLTRGMESRREAILQALEELFRPVAMVARNDASVRQLEGLPRETRLLAGEIPSPLIVHENGLRFRVDVLGGQKTGHFLDQKENHRALEGRVGAEVLDLFCYSGSWAVHAAAYGAERVVGVDISASAVDLARENASLNGLRGCSFLKADVFDLLREYEREGERFDTVILDPPAFVKSRKKLAEAVRGYLTVNRRAMQLIVPGGYLVTCTCSHHLSRERFIEVLRKAGVQAGRALRLVEMRGQAYDHPVLLSCPETEYLKCAVLQVW